MFLEFILSHMFILRYDAFDVKSEKFQIIRLGFIANFQNTHIFQHNGFINVDKKYIGSFLSKRLGYKKGIKGMIF